MRNSCVLFEEYIRSMIQPSVVFRKGSEVRSGIFPQSPEIVVFPFRAQLYSILSDPSIFGDLDNLDISPDHRWSFDSFPMSNSSLPTSMQDGLARKYFNNDFLVDPSLLKTEPHF